MAFRVNYRGNQGSSLGPLGFLIVANLIVFVVTSIRPELIDLLGLSGQTFLSQPWTIVTNMFVHDGFGHIFGNMLTLYFYGSYLINLVGERDFFIVYFVGGLIGNVVFLLLPTSLGGVPPWVVAIGASGAVFAVGGALMILRPKLKVFVIPIPVALPLWVVVIGGFLILTSPGIAWQAHLGGLALGLVAGYYFKRRPRLLY